MTAEAREPLRGPLGFGEGPQLYWFAYERPINVGDRGVLRYFLAPSYFDTNRCLLFHVTGRRQGWHIRATVCGRWDIVRSSFVRSATDLNDPHEIFSRAEQFYGGLVQRYSGAWFGQI